MRSFSSWNIFSPSLSRLVFPNILFSNISLSSPSSPITCYIQFFFLAQIVFFRHLVSSTLFNTISLLTVSLYLMSSDSLHNHISSICHLFISSCSNAHVSHPYSTTGHINHLSSSFSVCYTILVLKYFFSYWTQLLPIQS